MSPRASILLAATILGGRLLLPCPVPAEEPAEDVVASLAAITVTAEKLTLPTRQTNETVYTGREITARGIEIQGAQAATSVSGALDILPGITVERAENNGLGAEMGSARFRGVRSALGAMTVAGVPNYGGNPIGPRDYLYDLENIEGIAVYRGAVPGDLGTGVGSRGGAMELKPLWPRDAFAVLFRQYLGSDSFSRSYLRLDSGKFIGSDTRFSAAVSYGEADKWRGPGKLGPRKNANLALSQGLGERAGLKLWFNHNDLDQHLFRPLSFADIQNLKENYAKDYNAAATGVAAQDIFYYDYNRGTYRNDDLLALFTVMARPWLSFSLKPYYGEEDTRILQGVTSGGGRIQERTRDITRAGIIGEGVAELDGVKTVLGYHYEKSAMRIFNQIYAITADGLAYRGYGVLATSGDTSIHSPYLKLAGSSGPWDWQAGIKYFRFEDSASEGYVTGPAPDYAPVRAADLDRHSASHSIWLPTVGLSRRLTDGLAIQGSYGRNFTRPYSYMPLVTLYNSNRATFLAQGIPLAELFAGYGMEKSDSFDLGLRYSGEHFELAPTLFYGRHRNLLTTVSDPRVALNYQQNIGKAGSHGLELEMNAFLSETLSIFVNPSYTAMTYDEDLSHAGALLASKGKQVVDTPLWLVKAGIFYQPGRFSVMPMFRCLGSRYADAENKEKIPAAALVDLRMHYRLPDVPWAREMKISLELNNLFDKRYVSVINASDDSREGQATFHPGAPFSAVLGLSFVY